MNPLTDPLPREVPLPQAPLLCVVAQLRFPLITSINDPGFIGPFQEAIRRRYPTLREDRTQTFTLGIQGPIPGTAQVAWRFSDGGGWQVSLAPDFLSIQADTYTSRADFLKRFGEVVQALQIHISPGSIDRLGLRYVDRVVDAGVADMREMINPMVLGINCTDLDADHTVTESLLRFDGRFLLARWGHLPPQATIDPSVMKPVDVPSWVLDLDAYVNGPLDFDVAAVSNEARVLAERAYAFFRWAVTDTFLKRFGGQP